MPATLALSSPQLGIVLDNAPDGKPHRPGDTITGHVLRTTVGVAPGATVTVTIHGRSKSKIQKSRGQSTSRYRTSFNCLSAPVDTQVLLSGAPLHIPEGSAGESWPFAITIPPLVRDIRDNWQRKYFTAPGGALETPFPPPGTFSFRWESFMASEKCETFTEYYVQAKLELLHQYKGRTTRESHIATAPFPLRDVNPGPPITDFNMTEHRRAHTVTTYRLVPGVTELSFSQQTRQTLNSSKVPKLAFNVTLSLPRTLQVNNENTIPIILAITPNTRSSSEIIHDIPQQVTIKLLQISIKPRTFVQAERHDSSKSSPEVNLVPNSAVASLRQQICIPVTPGAGAKSVTLDLGEILGIRMPQRGLHPDFITYNIAHKHEMLWKVTGHVAGEYFTLSSSQSVQILPGPGEVDGDELPGYSRGKDAPPAYDG
ncbi:hypothetical protein BJX76DRAFT_316507 [Aspergillus varians]